MHNINIWYISDNGTKNVCGKIINEPIEKCIIFTMKNDIYRGSISLDEVHKIIYLSNILSNYITPEEFIEEKIDKNNRKIIVNKYKVLNKLYYKNLNF